MTNIHVLWCSILGSVMEKGESFYDQSQRNRRPAPVNVQLSELASTEPLRSPFRNMNGPASLGSPSMVRQPSVLPRRKRKGSVSVEDIPKTRTSLLGPVVERNESERSSRTLPPATAPSAEASAAIGRRLFAASHGAALPSRPVAGRCVIALVVARVHGLRGAHMLAVPCCCWYSNAEQSPSTR